LAPFPIDRADPLEPPPDVAALRAEAPVTQVALPTDGWAWLVTRHADVRQVLRDPVFSADMTRPGFPLLRQIPRQVEQPRGGAFIRMDPPEHTRYRRMLTKEFMIRAVQRLEPVIEGTVDRFLDGMAEAGPPADLVEAFALPVPSMVICHMLGVPYADHEFFQSRSRTLLARDSDPDEVQRAADELQAYLDRLVATKEADPQGADDLLGRLIAERLPTGELSHDDVVGVAMLLLIAGHETTANMIGLGTLVLLQHPHQFAALREDPGLAAAAVEELLRYLTIVHTGLPRVATADTEVGGQRIRAGEGVIAFLASANRDEEVFSDPAQFDIQRDAQSHVAFGFGVHQCLGQPLARAELRAALPALARRLPTLELAVPVSDVPFRHDMFIYGVHRLPVTW
jgi:cytochrome P450